jgi:hypothetical protein
MKKLLVSIAACVFLSGALSSCYYYNDDDVAIKVQDNVDEYKLSARFNERKTRAVQNYIEDYTGSDDLFTSAGSEIDGDITIDNGTQVYIKCKKGRLKIKLDKDGNSYDSYENVKDMCEGIKELLAEN